MTFQIWRAATIFTNPSVLLLFDHSHQASEGCTFTMKKIDCIMSGQLDNPSSNVQINLAVAQQLYLDSNLTQQVDGKASAITTFVLHS